jgi:hypothetical protein
LELLYILVVVLVVSPILIGVWSVARSFRNRESREALTTDRRKVADRRRRARPVDVDHRQAPRREHEVAEDFVGCLKSGGG